MLLACAASAAANVLVVRSNIARHPAGQSLPDNVRFALGPGETVTVIGPRGSRNFRGPGYYSPADPVRPGERAPAPPAARIGGFSLSSIERGRQGAGTYVVIRSSGPSAAIYPLGRRMRGDERVTLRPGDALVLLTAGGTRTLQGPGAFMVQPPPRTAAGVVAGNLLGHPSRSRPNAFRDPAAYVAARPGAMWQADVRQGGTICLPPGEPPSLWRARPTAAATLTVTGPDGRAQSLSWPAGVAIAAWPRDVPVTPGADYRLALDGGAPVQVRFARLERAPTDLAGAAELLIAQGCQAQLDLLGEAAGESGAPPPPPPTRITVDASRDATICLPPRALVALRREEGDAGLVIESTDGHVANVAGSDAWPANLPLNDGARYTLRSSAGAHAVTFRTTGPIGDPVAAAQTLLELGCGAQLDELIADAAPSAG